MNKELPINISCGFTWRWNVSDGACSSVHAQHQPHQNNLLCFCKHKYKTMSLMMHMSLYIIQVLQVKLGLDSKLSKVYCMVEWTNLDVIWQVLHCDSQCNVHFVLYILRFLYKSLV